MGEVLSLTRVLALHEPKWCIDTLLPVEGVLVLGGPPKTGKSRLMLDTTLRALRGRPAFGTFKQTVARALYYNAEGGAHGMRLRASMYAHLGQATLDRMDVSGAPFGLTLGNGGIIPGIVERLAREWEPYDLVVLDPLVAFHTCDENNNQQMHAVFGAIRTAAEHAHASVAVVHHTSKPGHDSTLMDRLDSGGMLLRGASAIHGAADNIIVAWPVKRPPSVKLAFDTRYERQVDHIGMVADKVSGLFYRDVGGGMGDPEDFAADWGWDQARYCAAFGVQSHQCTAFLAARRDSGTAVPLEYVLRRLE